MKKKITTFLLAIGFSTISYHLRAQNISELNDQKEVLELFRDLMDKKIDLAKENEENSKIAKDVVNLNKKSDKSTTQYSPSDPETTATDAKKTARILRKVEDANRDLTKSNGKILDIESDIKKLEMKLDKLSYTIELKAKKIL